MTPGWQRASTSQATGARTLRPRRRAQWNEHDFIARYAGIYEHSPWVAERVAPIAEEVDETDQLAELMAGLRR